MTHIAISGAHGYLGGEMTRTLREKGHRITEFVREPASPAQRKFVMSEAGLEIGDTSDIEVFIHCAWILSGRAHEAAALNTHATKELVQVLQRSNTRMIFISSMAAFPKATSWYGRSKLEVERAVVESGGVAVRPGALWGGENGGILGAIERVIRLFHVAPLFGGEGTHIFLVRVQRVCEIVDAIARGGSAYSGRVLSIFDQPRFSLRDLYRKLARDAGTWVVCVPVPTGACLGVMRLCEWIGLRLPLRSDSIVSITHPNPHVPPDIQEQFPELGDAPLALVHPTLEK